MKTKDLIRELQELDPTGELEVTSGNCDIHFVSRQPSYYDGCAKILIRDESKKPYYDIIGVRICSEGEKIRLHTINIDSIFLDVPEAIIEYDSEYSRDHYHEIVEKTRVDMKKIIEEVG
jgi:hypothetical protein